MKKNLPVIIACILIACSVVMLVNHFKGNNHDEVKDELNIIEDIETDYIDDNEEILYSDETSKYDVNEEYFDQDFVVYMKENEYDDVNGVHNIVLNFRNVNEEARNIEYYRISCEVNEQSVVLWTEGTKTVEGKENTDVTVSCLGAKEDKINVVYISTLFNGQNVTVKFGKK